MADAAPPPVVRGPRVPAALPLAALWTAAAVPFVLGAVHLADPELAVRLHQAGSAWARHALAALALAAAVALLLLPPARAGLRLAVAQAQRRLSTDRAPLARALGELQHFESPARHLEVGRLAVQCGETERALVHLRRALELDPRLPAAHHLAGRVLLRAGHLAQARQHFLAAEQLEPGHAFGDALLHAGRAAARLGRHDEAVRLLTEHQGRHGGSAQSQLWLGDALATAGDHAGARHAWRQAAAPPAGQASAEANWYRALARVRLWRHGGSA
ncbi:MAG: tetratricopeptide repeat protein [Planctomycetes bacterium]|nr:tetratricopeptide repeat protein [Planctomycetota bacterium]